MSATAARTMSLPGRRRPPPDGQGRQNVEDARCDRHRRPRSLACVRYFHNVATSPVMIRSAKAMRAEPSTQSPSFVHAQPLQRAAQPHHHEDQKYTFTWNQTNAEKTVGNLRRKTRIGSDRATRPGTGWSR